MKARGSFFFFGTYAPAWPTSNSGLRSSLWATKSDLSLYPLVSYQSKGKDIQHSITGSLAQFQSSLPNAVYLSAKDVNTLQRIGGPAMLGHPCKESFLLSSFQQITSPLMVPRWHCTEQEAKGSIPESAGWISQPPNAYPPWQMLPWEFIQQRLILSRCSSALLYI